MINLNLITVGKLAECLGVPKSTVYSWKRNGNIPKNCFKKIGGTIFVIESAITKFFNSSEGLINDCV